MAQSLNARHDHISLKASTDYSSTGKYRFMRQSGTLAVYAGVNKRAIGILQNDPQSNEIATIDISPGLQKVYSGGSINNGAVIVSDASGGAVAATPVEGAISSGDTGIFAAGFSIEKVTTSGQLMSIIFNPMYVII